MLTIVEKVVPRLEHFLGTVALVWSVDCAAGEGQRLSSMSWGGAQGRALLPARIPASRRGRVVVDWRSPPVQAISIAAAPRPTAAPPPTPHRPPPTPPHTQRLSAPRSASLLYPVALARMRW